MIVGMVWHLWLLEETLGNEVPADWTTGGVEVG